jgi:hypothetical protein
MPKVNKIGSSVSAETKCQPSTRLLTSLALPSPRQPLFSLAHHHPTRYSCKHSARRQTRHAESGTGVGFFPSTVQPSLRGLFVSRYDASRYDDRRRKWGI